MCERFRRPVACEVERVLCSENGAGCERFIPTGQLLNRDKEGFMGACKQVEREPMWATPEGQARGCADAARAEREREREIRSPRGFYMAGPGRRGEAFRSQACGRPRM